MCEWISVNDVLPNEYQNVIVSDIYNGEIFGVTGAIHVKDGYFVVDDYGLEASNYDGCASIRLDMNITHWMKLPKPSKESENG